MPVVPTIYFLVLPPVFTRQLYLHVGHHLEDVEAQEIDLEVPEEALERREEALEREKEALEREEEALEREKGMQEARRMEQLNHSAINISQLLIYERAKEKMTKSKMAALDLSLPTVFLIIDNHAAFDNEAYWGKRSNPQYKENVTALVNAFRATHTKKPHVEVIHVGHSSTDVNSILHPDHPDGGGAFYPFTEPIPGELVIWKNVNSSFIGTDLEKTLRAKGVRQLVISGLTAEHCVSTTTRMAGNLGVTDAADGSGKGRVILVGDATASFPNGQYDADTIHGVSVATLEEFAEVVKTADVLQHLQPLL
ncbi:hypothetical protein FQN49_002880 [Arthroderma sp. PD_2]|nr:hypothetical protein FQN49_002880 [Arthroderma sp. PD_2]